MGPWRTDGRMVQEPVPELAQLRGECAFQEASVHVLPHAPARVPGLAGCCFDITATIQSNAGMGSAGILLRSWLHAGEGLAEPCAAAILVDWQQQRLEVRAVAGMQSCHSAGRHHFVV